MDTSNIEVGVVGLGLMGTSIATCLLMAEHPVMAIAPIWSRQWPGYQGIWSDPTKKAFVQKGLRIIWTGWSFRKTTDN